MAQSRRPWLAVVLPPWPILGSAVCSGVQWCAARANVVCSGVQFNSATRSLEKAFLESVCAMCACVFAFTSDSDSTIRQLLFNWYPCLSAMFASRICLGSGRVSLARAGLNGSTRSVVCMSPYVLCPRRDLRCMSSTGNTHNRPISPHVTIYKFPLAAVSSIANRASAVALSASKELFSTHFHLIPSCHTHTHTACKIYE